MFAPKAELWARWAEHDPASVLEIDHSAWDRFLQTYVRRGDDGIARLPYGEVSAEDRRALADYVAAMQTVDIVRYSRAQQLAYWINFYNAATVQIVLRHYPVAGIRDIDISPGVFADGPWGKKLLSVAGEPLSLNDIEHRILRPIWRDPRVHYAVNCASLGCSDLRERAYKASAVESALDAAARAYINHPRGARVEGGKLFVSSIYNWFRDDFGRSDREVIQHLERYAEPALADKLRGIERIAGYDYDWRLNDIHPAAKSVE